MNAYLVQTKQDWAAVVIAPGRGRAKTVLLQDGPGFDLEFLDIGHPKLLRKDVDCEECVLMGHEPLYRELIDVCPRCECQYPKGQAADCRCEAEW